jgi:hypothetical protein
MAINANADTERITFIAGANARTTTSQYMVAYLSGSMTASVVTSLGAQPLAIGIIDSFQSSGSQAVSVIVHGLAKGYMADSCTAGRPLVPSTAGTLQPLLQYTLTSIGTGTTLLTCTTTIIGTALQAGRTAGAMMVFVNTMRIFN